MEKWTAYDQMEYDKLKKAYFLCLFLGWAGAHRFYQKKIGTGVLYLLTFGLFAIGWLVDGLKIAIAWQKMIDMKNGRSRKDVLRQARSVSQKVLMQNAMKRCCPSCGGTNYHAFVEERVIREGKVKTKTSLNLNPLKPFTVFNHKEKMVRKPITTQVSKFVCDDCGKIF